MRPMKFASQCMGQGLRPFKDWGHCVGLRNVEQMESTQST
jgi:hypothetical protein